jgi:hypothetical protein
MGLDTPSKLLPVLGGEYVYSFAKHLNIYSGKISSF